MVNTRRLKSVRHTSRHGDDAFSLSLGFEEKKDFGCSVGAPANKAIMPYYGQHPSASHIDPTLMHANAL